MRKIMIDTNIYALFKRTKIYHDLDHLAGTWSEKDLREFQKNVEDLEKVDKEIRK